MKNCVVFVGMAPQGIIRHFALFALQAKKMLEARDVDFFFAATDDTSGAKGAIWKIVRDNFPANRILDGKTYGNVAAKIYDLFTDYDRVVAHFQGGRSQLLPLVPIKKKFGSRLVLIAVTQYFRNDSWRRVPMSIYQYFLYSRYVDLVNFQSPFAARKFVGGQKLFAQGKGTVIPMGCDPCPVVPKTVPASIAAAGLEETLVDDSLFKFAYLATFRPGKRHEWLVRALAEELRTHPQVRLVFCGPLVPFVVEKLRMAMKECEVERQVLISDSIPHVDLPWLLQRVNCAIVPSVSETFGHTYVEPMMAGLPLLGTRVGAGEYVIRDYETGLSFELGSPLTLRRAFREIVEHLEQTKRMGATARKLAEVMFSFEEVARMWVGTYMRFLENGEVTEKVEQK